MPRPRNLATRMRNPSLRGSIAENTDLVLIIIIGDVGVKLAAFLVTEKLVAALCAEHEMNDDVGEGLGHTGNALTGLRRFVGTVDLGLRSWDSLQPRLSHGGPSALPNWRAVSP